MSFLSWLQNLRSAQTPGRGQRHRRKASLRAATHRPNLEVLEDRCLPSFSPATSFPVGATAVIAADFNHDTVPDLALNTGEVLLGHGDGTFDSPVNSDVGSSPIAVGDLDGDGNLDLVAADAHDVRVFLGHGDGTLAAPSNINVTDPNGEGWMTSVAVGDFNGDGLLDLGVTSNVYFHDGYDSYYGNFGHYQGSAHVLVGTGGAAFSGPNTTWLGDGYLYGSAAADFNGDGIDDFATTTDNTQAAVRVLLGDASGFLQSPTAYNTAGVPLRVAVADLDGDLDADLVTVPYVSVLLGNGAGGFGSHQYYDPGSYSVSVALADFNGDGRLDIATTSYSFSSSTSYVSVLVGYGDGTFATAITQDLGTGSSYASAAADFDGDGLPDVAVVRMVGPGAGSQVDVLLNAGDWNIPAAPSVRVNDVTVTEGNTGTVNATFTLTLSYASNVAVTVHYVTADITAAAGSDYVAASGDVVIPAGQTSRTFTVAVKGDRLPEPNETFSVNLSSPTNATIAHGQGIGTILDDEPSIRIADATVNEGNTGTRPITFTVSLSMAYDVPVTISYATANSTATAGSDYQAKSGTLTIPAGQTSKTITVQVSGDRVAELNETFVVNLTNPNYGVISDGQGVGTIVDDEPRISISDVTKTEGKKGQTTSFTFTVTLSAAYDQAVTMSFRTVDGTATTSDSDYIAKTGTLTFAPGETTKTITIEVKGDSKQEANETFYLDLFGNGANSLFTKNRGIGTILNDD